MRTNENSAFTLHKTATRDWYLADDVDEQLADSRKANLRQRVADMIHIYPFERDKCSTNLERKDCEVISDMFLLCEGTTTDLLVELMNKEVTIDEIADWLIEQGGVVSDEM